MWRKFFRIGSAIAILIIALIVAIDKTHPIILGWLSGTARIIGKPINAKVYTDGRLTNEITVYKVNSYPGTEIADNYLLNLKTFDKYGMLKFINIDLKENWVGRPVGTSTDDYDIINGYLFQSKVGGHFVDFKDDMKGFNLDPQLTRAGKQISFKVPPGYLGYNLIRIQLE